MMWRPLPDQSGEGGGGPPGSVGGLAPFDVVDRFWQGHAKGYDGPP